MRRAAWLPSVSGALGPVPPSGCAGVAQGLPPSGPSCAAGRCPALEGGGTGYSRCCPRLPEM